MKTFTRDHDVLLHMRMGHGGGDDDDDRPWTGSIWILILVS